MRAISVYLALTIALRTAYAIDSSGFMLPAVIAVTALLFWLRRQDVEQPRVLAPTQP